jgi:hypothetical protein
LSIEQRGWERLGDAAPPRQARTKEAWGVVADAFVRAAVSARRD